MGFAYVLEFPNGKHYIGITTKSVDHRFRIHRNTARSGSHLPVHKAMRHFGDQVVCRTLVEADLEYLNWVEPRLIESYDTLVSGQGYNVALGGLVNTLTEEQKELCRRRFDDPEYKKMIMSHLHSPEARKKTGEAMREHWADPEYKARVGKAISKSRTGIVFSDDTRKKMSESAKKRQSSMTIEQRQRQSELGRKNSLKRWRK